MQKYLTTNAIEIYIFKNVFFWPTSTKFAHQFFNHCLMGSWIIESATYSNQNTSVNWIIWLLLSLLNQLKVILLSCEMSTNISDTVYTLTMKAGKKDTTDMGKNCFKVFQNISPSLFLSFVQQSILRLMKLGHIFLASIHQIHSQLVWTERDLKYV